MGGEASIGGSIGHSCATRDVAGVKRRDVVVCQRRRGACADVVAAFAVLGVDGLLRAVNALIVVTDRAASVVGDQQRPIAAFAAVPVRSHGEMSFRLCGD